MIQIMMQDFKYVGKFSTVKGLIQIQMGYDTMTGAAHSVTDDSVVPVHRVTASMDGVQVLKREEIRNESAVEKVVEEFEDKLHRLMQDAGNSEPVKGFKERMLAKGYAKVKV